MTVTEPAGQQHCGFVALIGAPNAGKSTLVNALVGMVARSLARSAEASPVRAQSTPGEARSEAVLPRALVWLPSVAAAVVGFVPAGNAFGCAASGASSAEATPGSR